MTDKKILATSGKKLITGFVPGKMGEKTQRVGIGIGSLRGGRKKRNLHIHASLIDHITGRIKVYT